MWKVHKKRHHRLAKAQPPCCNSVFVNHPPWGEADAPGRRLPLRWITGIQGRRTGDGQR
jgi:hypothetical protein